MNVTGTRMLALIVRPPLRCVRRGLGLPCALLLCLAALGGCKSNATDNVTIDGIYGPAGRQAVNLVEQAQREAKGDDSAGKADLEAAVKLYEELKYREARKAFKDIAKKYGKKKEHVEEDAMFYMAECDFQLGYLARAEDEYEELLKKFPSTGYLEKSVAKIFRIACVWLNAPKPASEIELASFAEEDGEERLSKVPEANIAHTFPLKPNFTDKTRPMFDTRGRALGALRQVWLSDPRSKLADEALMLCALYHFRMKDWREAELNFQSIREQHHSDKYLQAAYVLGAHASMKSYQGSQYDGQQLETAKKLTSGAIALFPDSPQRQKLQRDLKKMEAEAAERDWERVKFYAKRGENKSAAFYAEYIVETYPDSPRVADARELLVKLGPEYSADILKTPLVANASPPAEPEGGDAPEPGRLRISDQDAKPISETE